MGVTWTEEQQKVISLRDRNILVSAAAGSGRCPSILLSTLSGRTFLSAGTKCHDTGILSSSHSR